MNQTKRLISSGISSLQFAFQQTLSMVNQLALTRPDSLGNNTR